MRLLKPLLACLCITLSGCETATEPEFGMTDWYLRNGVGSNMTLVVYDRICNRTHNRVRLSRGAEVGISTCSNSNGMADIRYRRASQPGGDNPWRDTMVRPNESLLVRY